MPAKGITASIVCDLLRKRYDPPAWAFLEQVRNGTGYSRVDRYADGLAMSLWPSRGLEVHGFEVKVTRSDVVAELRKPDKAEPIMQYCDRWWLVLGDKALIEPGELPPTWGLMIVRGTTQLRAVTEAPKLEPKPLDVRFIASILRNFEQAYVPRRLLSKAEKDLEETVDAKVKEQLDKDGGRRLESLKLRAERAEENSEAAQKLIRDFNTKAGVHLASYSLGDISDAVRIVQGTGQGFLKQKLRHINQIAEGLVKETTRGIEWVERHEEESDV